MVVQNPPQIRDAIFGTIPSIFPSEIYLLNLMTPVDGWDGAVLDELGRQIHGYLGLSAITTSDGCVSYVWPFALKFEVNNGEALRLFYVAFPRNTSGAPERSIAVYADWGVTPEEIAKVLDELFDLLDVPSEE